MKLYSQEELKNFNQILVVDDIADSKLIYKHIKKDFKKILILCLSTKLPKDIELLINKYNNITFKLFTWSIFNDQYHERWHSHKSSIENVDNAYKKILNKNKSLINFFIRLYSSRDVVFSFKKSIAIHLNKYYELVKIYELIKQYNKNTIPIIQKQKYLYIKKLINHEISSDFHQVVLFYNKNKFDKERFFQTTIFIFYPLFALLSVRKFIFKKIKKKLGIRIYKHGIGFSNRYNVGWIIDNKSLDKKNLFFLIEDQENNKIKEDLVKNRYDFQSCSNRIPLKNCSLTFFIKIIFFYIPLGIFFSPIIFFSNKLIRREALTAWIKFFIWRNFISVYKIDSYLTYHNFTSDHIYRNILLKKIKCLTVMYKHTHSENVFDYKNKKYYAHVVYMNLYYDIEYHWSKCSIEMSKSNDSKSKEFLITGPIWSSREFLNKKNHNIINIEKNLKNICLFNSSFPGYNAVNSIASHRNFLLLALEIIKTYPNFNIIFKSKNDFNLYATHEKTRELHKKLLDMKNIKIAEKGSFSPLIIQNTDLAISMSFASTGLEAMCLGVRSFYVDLTNTFKNSYFDNFDNLVSHSNVEALNNIEYWINISKENILLKYSQLFSSLGIEEGNRSTEIIRNRIIENSKKYLN